ncbi:MAG: hypothetical protein IPP71_12620 [Bacteroidetes bacterium]|nr:hypothetical protein [Bacteroidota bacterium]
MINIQIEGERKLSAIKSDFNTVFPFLKLEFFKAGHNISEASSKKELISKDLKVNDIRKATHTGSLAVTPALTVSELEMTFRDKFELNVQVFRKSGTVWLETSATDNMSLSQQNALGFEKSQPVETTDLTDIDYD